VSPKKAPYGPLDLERSFSIASTTTTPIVSPLDLRENEYDNELLASIDMENTVRNNTNNSVIESEISKQVTYENTEARPTSSNKKKQPKVCKHVVKR